MDFARFQNDKCFYLFFFASFLLILLMMHGDLFPLTSKHMTPIYDKLVLPEVSEEPNHQVPVTLLHAIGASNKTEIEELMQLILDRQRVIIDDSLKDYKYHPSLPVDSYEDLLLEYSGKPVRNMIATTWRSGSTFLGDLLLSHPASFYHYEPLLPYGINRIRDKPLSVRAVRDLKKLFNCDYSGMEHYFKFAKSHQFLFEHNLPLWKICLEFPQLCQTPLFLSSLCKLFPFQVIKTVRLNVALTEDFLKDSSAQVLLLVRDPRGTMQSRHHRTWCPKNADCSDPRRLCGDLIDDYRAAKKFIVKYPKQFIVIRYEDLSLDIYNQSTVLYDFFRLTYDHNVKLFLDTHTSTHKGGVSSTFRDSKTAPIHWRKDLIWEEVNFIQDVCTEALHLWGYELALDEKHLKTFNPIGKFSFSLS